MLETIAVATSSALSGRFELLVRAAKANHLAKRRTFQVLVWDAHQRISHDLLSAHKVCVFFEAGA